MENRIRFWGINFRSESHLNHFKLSSKMLCFCLILPFLYFFGTKIINEEFQQVFKIVGGSIVLSFCLMFAVFHGAGSIIAFKETHHGKISSVGNWSTNCIWFNGLLFAIYIILSACFILFAVAIF